MSQSRPTNRLARETSPYLLQHAHNPVDWHPWGPEALALARQLDRPIFLSIGYSACHWCHVMERESFEDPLVAQQLNQSFVCIKVDREERPDLDEIYMHAVQLMTGRGGWPMSVWLTPELRPFYAGTYFPPEDRYGMPSFRRVVEHIRGLWADKRSAVVDLGAQLTQELARLGQVEATPGDLTPALFDNLVRMSKARYDDVHGGWGGGGQYAPKFPHPMELSMLLRCHARGADATVLAMAEHTLERMARGGIYDQLGGGFHRYSTDREWLVPHFEKMLYDNALLMRTYAEAFLLTGKPFYATIAQETADYVLRELQAADGGLWSTQDADSEGEEGRFFVWTLEEFGRAAGKDAEIAAAWFGVTTSGNWEHRNILTARKTAEQVAVETRRGVAEVKDAVARARQALWAQREQRVKPGLDDKVLTAWNGLAIAGLARVGVALEQPRYVAAAARAAEFVWRTLRAADGTLLRTSRHGEARLGGYLEDYAFVGEGLLDLFEADGDPRWLERALALSQVVQQQFHDAQGGGYCFTPAGRADILVRTKQATESSIPSATAVTALNELRLAALTGDATRRDRAAATLKLYRLQMEQFGAALCGMLQAVDFLLADGPEVVLTGPAGDATVAEMARAVRRRFPPHHVLLLASDATAPALARLTPLLAGRAPGKAAQAYVCRQGTCQAPVATAAALRALLH